MTAGPWAPTPTPYGNDLAGQHNFLSTFGTKHGIGLLWLDAKVRSQVGHDSMQEQAGGKDFIMGSVGLRYAALNAEGRVDYEQFVQPITCECCPTSAASTERGPVVVYRGRQEQPGTLPSEVREYRRTMRDIYIVLQESGVWRKPHLVHKDNCIINGCPDNGPAVDASANHAAVAWWTRSNNQPKVQLAFSSGSGDSFGSAFRIDSGQGEGQVTVALVSDACSAIVGWLEEDEVRARYVSNSGTMSRAVVLGSSPHHSRLPRWLANRDGSVTAVWTSKKGGSRHIEVSRIDLQQSDRGASEQ